MLKPKANLGLFDRLLRLLIGIGLIIYSFFYTPWVAILGLFAIYEALNSWCVMYQLFGINTCPIKPKK